MLAVINPKTLLFSAAFLPQFLPASGGAVEGMVLVAAVFLAVLFVGDLVWVALAGIARTLLERYWVWRNRLAGSFLLAAGVALALMHGNA